MIKIFQATYSHYFKADMQFNLRRRYKSFLSQRGSYAIEFAMTLPILLIILSGTIDYGWYFHIQMGVINATGTAAHAGSQIDAMIDADRYTPSPIEVAHAVANDVWTASALPGVPTFSAAIVGESPDQDIVVTSVLSVPPLVNFFGTTPDIIDYTSTWHMNDQSEHSAF